MKFFEELEWTNWKNSSDSEKEKIITNVLEQYLPNQLKLTSCILADFELYGIKCRTFELELNDELYLFIPGNQEAILGWDLGVEGLRRHELINCCSENDDCDEKIVNSETFNDCEDQPINDATDLTTLAGISNYINQHTTELRKTPIPPMIVQKYALPVGTEFMGIFDTITGSFEGTEVFFDIHKERLHQLLFPKLSLDESLHWSFPETILEPNNFYLEGLPESNHYLVYSQRTCSYRELSQAVKNTGFDLLTVDQWEFAVGAGTRRLFRWGNELLIPENTLGKKIQWKIAGANMFGLVIDSTQKRFELTKDPSAFKLGPQENRSEQLIENMLPLSTYYCSDHRISDTEILNPDQYLYRKGIIIE